MKKFYTQFVRPEKKPEFNSGELKTEMKGYIPPRAQVENLILSGKKLVEYRREAYDFGVDEKIDDTFEDPTRNPDFDLADAGNLASGANERLLAQEMEAKKKLQEEKDAEKAKFEAWKAEQEKVKTDPVQE